MESCFNISAGELKVHLVPKIIQQVKKEEIPVVTLAPFTNNTKISFENAPIGIISMQKVIVENPSAHAMQVSIKSLPSNEKNVTVNWESATIPANDSVMFEVSWNPIEVDTWRHTITFQFGRCSRKDMPITFKSIPPKKLLKKQNKRIGKENGKPNGKEFTLKPIIRKTVFSEKENITPFKKTTSKIQFLSDDRFNIIPLNSHVRRDTYTVNDARLCHIKEEFNNISDDSLNEINENDLHNVSSETYNKGNISSATYVKGNLSTATYIKGNLSTETYIKDHLSSETYVKDEAFCTSKTTWSSRRSSSLIGNVSHIEDDINLSPIFGNSSIHQKHISEQKIQRNVEVNWFGKNRDLCFDDYSPKTRPPSKRKSDMVFDISPAKKPHFGNNSSINSSSRNLQLDWNKTKKVQKGCLAGTSYFDPFMSESVYNNQEWMEKQEIIFKNWLNALLTPPVELDSNADDQPINVAKLWQECKQKAVPIAPSKENISNKYHTNHRLDSLRKSALSLFRSDGVSGVLTKTILNVENEKLSIRADRNVHLDLGLQSEIMTLLLSYNPLWLRIGLETVYNKSIALNSNSDIMGLSNFLMQNFFKDSYLLQKFKTIHSPKYTVAIKKFILKKFLTLVYFLDFAKCKRLIGHDPCLFRRTAPMKESREIILAFSRELLSSVGDVTRLLRFMGYVVNHKQTYIQEFNYSVIHLGVDLRDGIRLTKVMEIILMRKNFIECLRVPAVSRLQKIHNMKLVFQALQEANFEILGDIDPKDVVDGHHEKTLSFLWQIIYKFQAPLMVNASIKIQCWWRSLAIVLKRRIATKLRVAAAIKIQKWYRRHLLALKFIRMIPLVQDILRQKLLNKSDITIQSVFKMYIQRKRYRQIKASVALLQNQARGYLVRKSIKHKMHCVAIIQSYVRMWIQRKEFLRLCASVIYIQQAYRAKQSMLKQRAWYQNLIASTLIIQERYRGKQLMKIERERYLSIKVAAITIQTYFRAFTLMKIEKCKYQRIKWACITIQKRYRSNRTIKKHVKAFEDIKRAVLIVQRRYRATRVMKSQLCNYQKLKKTTIFVQSHFRAIRKMRVEYNSYRNLKKAVLYTETLYVANQQMKLQRDYFLRLKSSAVCVQRRYRANEVMKIERQRYLDMKNATMVIQKRFKAHLAMQFERNRYQEIRCAIIAVQRYVRGRQAMKKCLNEYNRLKLATIQMQRRFRAKQLMKNEQTNFNKLKAAAIFVQCKFRANKMMKNERTNFNNQKNAALSIQRRYRAMRLGRIEYQNYHHLRRTTISVQMRFRANALMKHQRSSYEKLREATISLQRRFKANKLMQIVLAKFVELKNAVLIIQRRFRALQLMRTERSKYQTLLKAVRFTQASYRAKKLMKIESAKFVNLKTYVIVIQRRFRANCAMKIQRTIYQNVVKSVIVIQRWFRNFKLMQRDLLCYKKLKAAAVTIQTKFRAKKMMQLDYFYYQNLKKSVVFLQNRYRANCLMKFERENFHRLKKNVILVQRRFRANRMMKIQSRLYRRFVTAAVVIQQRYRAYKKKQMELQKFNTLKKYVVVVQRRYRANKLMRSEKNKYHQLKLSTIFIQRLFRAKKLVVAEITKYRETKLAIVTIQRRFKAYLTMKNEYAEYQRLKTAVVLIQTKYRAILEMRLERAKFLKLRNSAVIVQKIFRATKLMKIERDQYLLYRCKVIQIQMMYRATCRMKMERRLFQELRRAVLVVQRQYRNKKLMQLQHKEYCRLINAVVVIQRRFKVQKLMKTQYLKYRQIRRAAIIIQRQWRCFINTDAYKLKKRQTDAAVKLQAFWRGYSVRRKNHPEISTIRKNVEILNLTASSQNTLKHRKDRAIRILTETSTLLQILYALEDLDFITRRCKNTLKSLSKSLPEQLYIFLLCANRSPAEMELSTIAVSILINFYKFHETSKDTWIPTQVSNLITVMSHCCDKDDKLFPYLCTLIWLFAHNEDYKQFIRELPTFKSLFRKIQTLCLRKQKMVARMSSYMYLYYRPVTDVCLPMLTPDWGLDYPDRPRTFTNSIQALTSVLTILDFTI